MKASQPTKVEQMLFSALAGSRSVLTSLLSDSRNAEFWKDEMRCFEWTNDPTVALTNHHVELLSSTRCYCSCTEQVSGLKACGCIYACIYTQFLIWLPQDLQCLFDSGNSTEAGLLSGGSWFDISAKQETPEWGSKWLTLTSQ